jgi:hypothetical protein
MLGAHGVGALASVTGGLLDISVPSALVSFVPLLTRLGPGVQESGHGSRKRCSGLDLPSGDCCPGYAVWISHFNSWK